VQPRACADLPRFGLDGLILARRAGRGAPAGGAAQQLLAHRGGRGRGAAATCARGGRACKRARGRAPCACGPGRHGRQPRRGAVGARRRWRSSAAAGAGAGARCGACAGLAAAGGVCAPWRRRRRAGCHRGGPRGRGGDILRRAAAAAARSLSAPPPAPSKNFGAAWQPRCSRGGGKRSCRPGPAHACPLCTWLCVCPECLIGRRGASLLPVMYLHDKISNQNG